MGIMRRLNILSKREIRFSPKKPHALDAEANIMAFKDLQTSLNKLSSDFKGQIAKVKLFETNRAELYFVGLTAHSLFNRTTQC
jgi:hypothetical protein